MDSRKHCERGRGVRREREYFLREGGRRGKGEGKGTCKIGVLF
jgi:hypothetical protein